MANTKRFVVQLRATASLDVYRCRNAGGWRSLVDLWRPRILNYTKNCNSVAESSADHHLRALRRKSQNLAGQIFDFLKEWERNEPRTSGHLGEIWGKKEFDPEAFGKAFGEAGDLTRKYSDEMSLKFAKQFAGRVGNLRDELANEGFESAELDKKLQDRLRFKWDIQTVAEELQKLSDQIKD